MNLEQIGGVRKLFLTRVALRYSKRHRVLILEIGTTVPRELITARQKSAS